MDQEWQLSYHIVNGFQLEPVETLEKTTLIFAMTRGTGKIYQKLSAGPQLNPLIKKIILLKIEFIWLKILHQASTLIRILTNPPIHCFQCKF